MPHGLQLKIGLDASDYMEAAPFVSPHIAYAAGANEWAQWKVKYDELKAQQGAVWVKPKDVHKNGILHCCRMGGRTGYVYHSVVWDSDGRRWIGGLSDETREIEVLDESGSNELVAENEALRLWKMEAVEKLTPISAYCHKHLEVGLEDNHSLLVIAELDRLRQENERMKELIERINQRAINGRPSDLGMGTKQAQMLAEIEDLITDVTKSPKAGMPALNEGESNTPLPDLKTKGNGLALALRRLCRSVSVHPDYANNSEWGDYVSESEKVLAAWESNTPAGGEKEAIADLGTCKECGTRKATIDYNGHQYYVCDPCNNRLNREFDNEYK